MRVKRFFLAAVAVALSALLLISCAAKIETAPSAGVSFTDSLGRQVNVEKPERVAVLLGSFADIWCLAGGKDSIVAAVDDAWEDFDLNLSDSVENLGSVKSPSLESIVAAQPDFVIASGNTEADVEMLDSFEKMGINAAYFDVSSFEDYLKMLKICTDITGRPELYERYGAEVKALVDETLTRVSGERPKVLYIRAAGSVIKFKNSRGSVLGQMLADLGCDNIADNDKNLLENLSLESVLKQDPDYIFIVYQGSDIDKAEANLERTIFANPAWGELSAVKAGRYYVLDKELYNQKPNARWGEAYEKLADILYAG